MEKFDRRQYNIEKQRKQREALGRLDKLEKEYEALKIAVQELTDICNSQQDEIDELKASRMAYDRLQEDYDALEAEHRAQAALIEELKARLGID